MLLGEVPAAFHAGVGDILLIAFGLAWAEFLGTGGASIGIDVEGHGRSRGAGRRYGPVAHGGVVYHQISGVFGGRWVVLGAGDRR